ncbi:hypothetical protein [Bartonella refiksaydamii]|uniref:hypothetical protein n=1 Tax=Bartonella refiksaydamii TaxID=2654951 RepID=UPI0012ECB1E9|nr:hypothetical protein [Bartonella refiksaydamii]
MTVTWGVFLQWLAFFCVVGLVFALIYRGMRRLVVTRGRFWKWVGFGFILSLVSRFVYGGAQSLGVE